jgi:hypothetical protein
MRTIDKFLEEIVFFLSGAKSSMFLVFAFLCSVFQCHGQGTLTVTFQDPPLPLGNSDHHTSNEYLESGMVFTGHISRFWGPYWAYPYNGTVYLHTFETQAVTFSSLNGSLFDLIAVEFTEFSGGSATTKVQFVGYRPDGSSVTDEILTTGTRDIEGRPAFQTFNFRPEFKGLNRVEISGANGYALDNLAILIPEPASGTLLILGAAATFLLRRRLGRICNSLAPVSGPKMGSLKSQQCRIERSIFRPSFRACHAWNFPILTMLSTTWSSQCQSQVSRRSCCSPPPFPPGDSSPPESPYSTSLYDLYGINPNGDWLLYIVDDSAGGSGSITRSWCLIINP